MATENETAEQIAPILGITHSRLVSLPSCTMSKQANSITTKVVVRLLPPTMTKEELLVILEQAGYMCMTDFTVLYYIQGKHL